MGMTRFPIIAVFAALAVAAPAPAQTVKAGIEAWQKQDFAGAVGQWRPLAEKGDVDAAFNLGQAYRLGRGVPMNLAEAQKWFETAARKGHVDAATSLGILLFQNGNQVGSMRWLRMAAEAGEPRALLLYGTALYNGDGVKADPVLAYAYVSRAAAKGLEPAKATLADMDEMMPIEQRKRGIAIAMAAVPQPTKAKPPVAAKPALSKPTRIAPFASKPVAPKPAPAPAKTAPVAGTGGGWRVQLGAFSSRGAAQALYARLQGRLGGAGAFYIPVGAITRLQAGPFAGKAEAAATCARLKPQPCFPVPAK